jgi:ACS family tartrate transporter-like MFS transporter
VTAAPPAAVADGLPERVIKKAEWRILPVFFLGYVIAYADRINIGFAAETMNADLGFSAAAYGIGAGLFFAAYATLGTPAVALMGRFGLRRAIGAIMAAWGLVSVAMMAMTTPLHFYALRFLLGAAEAGFFPAVILYLSSWFPHRWRGRAISRFYIGVPMGLVVMGVVAPPVLAFDGSLGLQGWQWLMLIGGVPAVLLGLAVIAVIPDTPATAAWLDAEERQWLENAVASDNAKVSGSGHDSGSLGDALTNPMVLLFGALGFFTIGMPQAFQMSAPQIMASRTGLGTSEIGWLITIGGLGGVLAMLGNAALSDRAGDRFWHMVVPLACVGLCFLIIAHSDTPLLAMAGFIGLQSALYAFSGLEPTYISQVVSARTLGLGMAVLNSITQLGAFVAPVLFGLAKHATGSFDLGLALLPLGSLLGLVLMFAIRRHTR